MQYVAHLLNPQKRTSLTVMLAEEVPAQIMARSTQIK